MGATGRPEQQSAPNAAIRQHIALTDAERRSTFATVSTDEHFATQHPNGDVAGGRTAAQFTKTAHNESTNPDCSTPRDACRAVSTWGELNSEEELLRKTVWNPMTY